MGPTLNYQEKKKKKCFDQDSLALPIFWTSDAELIILWLLTGLSWDQSEAHSFTKVLSCTPDRSLLCYIILEAHLLHFLMLFVFHTHLFCTYCLGNILILTEESQCRRLIPLPLVYIESMSTNHSLAFLSSSLYDFQTTALKTVSTDIFTEFLSLMTRAGQTRNLCWIWNFLRSN